MGTWDVKTLRELGKLMDENESLYDRWGNEYKQQDISIVANSFEIYGERKKMVKKHHYRFQALVKGKPIDLFTKQEYKDMLKEQKQSEKEVKKMSKMWE